MEEGSVAKRAEELVVAASHRPAAGRIPQVPLADGPRGISQGFHAIGDRLFTERQAKILALVGGGLVELVAKPRLVAARVQTGPCGAAIRARDIRLRAANT